MAYPQQWLVGPWLNNLSEASAPPVLLFGVLVLLLGIEGRAVFELLELGILGSWIWSGFSGKAVLPLGLPTFVDVPLLNEPNRLSSWAQKLLSKPNESFAFTLSLDLMYIDSLIVKGYLI